MPNYKKMYLKLFNRITDVIAELQEIQQTTEEMYISDTSPRTIDICSKIGAPNDEN